jgi:hypothetical protein
MFASERGRSWCAYDAVSAVAWHQSVPIEMSEAVDPSARYLRSGLLSLDGFDSTLLPDADEGVREGNEGESGITLSGDADNVNEIAVMKFYPSEDYLAILSRQFAEPQSVDAFALPIEIVLNPNKNAFYRIRMNGFAALYAEAFVDEEGSCSGPGSTTFVFYRSKPERRIVEMRCRKV